MATCSEIPAKQANEFRKQGVDYCLSILRRHMQNPALSEDQVDALSDAFRECQQEKADLS